MIVIDPKSTPTRDLHQYLLGAVAPRPIALASTVDEDGKPNIAPYSFFNAFSSNPPIVAFSSNRRVTDNTTKDTLHNIKTNKGGGYQCLFLTALYAKWPLPVLNFRAIPVNLKNLDLHAYSQ